MPRSAATTCGYAACRRWSPRSAPTRPPRWSRRPGCVAATPAPPAPPPPLSNRPSPRRGRPGRPAGSWCAGTRRSAPARWSTRAVRPGRTFAEPAVPPETPGGHRRHRRHAWIPVRYPGAVYDEQIGQWISNAEVAETAYTAFASTTHKVTARLVVRRVRELNPAPRGQEELFPLWRHHAFLTDTDLPTVQADLTHRGHAIIEQVFTDLIDGPLARLPSGRFAANAAWLTLAAMTHNLTRAAGCLAGGRYAPARAAT